MIKAFGGLVAPSYAYQGFEDGGEIGQFNDQQQPELDTTADPNALTPAFQVDPFTAPAGAQQDVQASPAATPVADTLDIGPKDVPMPTSGASVADDEDEGVPMAAQPAMGMGPQGGGFQYGYPRTALGRALFTVGHTLMGMDPYMRGASQSMLQAMDRIQKMDPSKAGLELLKQVKKIGEAEDQFGNKKTIYGVPDPSGGGFLTVGPNGRLMRAGQQAQASQPSQPQQPPQMPVPQEKVPASAIPQGYTQPIFSAYDAPSDPYNEDALKNTTPDKARIARAIAQYRMAPPSMTRNNSYNREIMALVTDYNPNYDATTFPSRQRTINAFRAGPESRNVTALNTVGQHLEALHKSIEDLNNGDYPLANKAKQAAAWQFGDKKMQDKIKAAETAIVAVGTEAARAFMGAGQTALADREEWKKLFDITAPKSAQMASLRKISDLLEGRIFALAKQYNDGARTNHAPMDLVAPQTQKVFDKLREVGAETKRLQAAPQQATQPQQQTQQPQLKPITEDVLKDIEGGRKRGWTNDQILKTLKDNGYDTSGFKP